MATFITADEHFGHANIIRYCNRPFKSTDEMEDELIRRFNAKVKPNDFTIHCGDMFWDTVEIPHALTILSRLNGEHAYIWGNHEKPFALTRLLGDMFKWTAHVHEFNWNKHHIVLSHYAMRVWNKSHKGSWMLYGHSHGELPEVGLSFDIGVDQHNFEPWSLDEIAAKMATKTCRRVIAPEKRWPGKQFNADGVSIGDDGV